MTKVARALVLVTGAWAWSACTPHEEPPPAKAQAEPAAKAEPAPEAKVEPPPLAKVEPKPEPKIEPKPAPEPASEPPPTHAKVIEPKIGVTDWKELPGLSDIQGFYPFVIGVLADCGPNGESRCKLYDDGRLEVDDVELGGQIWGIWRSDAWRVEFDTRDKEAADPRAGIQMWEVMRIQRWRGSEFKTQWSSETEVDPNGYFDEAEARHARGERPMQDILFRKGWAGGMLVHDGSFKRLPESQGPAPRQVTPPENMLEFFEAESGALFTVAPESGGTKSGSLVVYPPCSEGLCRAQAFVLPPATAADPDPDSDEPQVSGWDFPLDAARGGDSLTILVVDQATANAYLLHYDVAPGAGTEPSKPGRWSFDALPADAPVPEVIWPDTRGGLWVEVSDALWYRDASGQWFEVGMPAGISLDFANRLKPRELLALVEVEGQRKVFATVGPVRAAPPPAQ